MPEKIVTIFGTGRAKQGDPACALALETGRLLAQAGFTIANGGYGGTMLAAAKGAAQAGGDVIGVTCSAFKSAKANKYVTRTIVTASLDERLDTLIQLGQAYLVLPGGTGTLLELAKVWELKNKGVSRASRPRSEGGTPSAHAARMAATQGFLNAGKPIILVGRFWRPLVDLVATDDPDSAGYVQVAEEPAQAVAQVQESERKTQSL